MMKVLAFLGISIVAIICLIAIVLIIGIIIGGILIPIELFIAWIDSIRESYRK